MNRHDQNLVTEPYVPSSSERVRDQVALYEATGGREGGTLEGRPVVILTMTGATSGKIRKTPVVVPGGEARRATPPGTTT
jgi:hypothetical protein